MEALQSFLTPSLVDLLTKIQNVEVPSSRYKSKKRSSPTDDSQRKKRNRITFDAVQVDQMEKVFNENQYPDAICRDELATRIQLDEERVQIWFQNRRAKYRRELRHSYHPYEPPKDVEFPFFKKAVSSGSESKSDNDNTAVNKPMVNGKTCIAGTATSDKDHPPMTKEKTSMAVSQEIGDQSIFMRALVDSADESANLNAVQLVTSLSLLLPASQHLDQKVSPTESDLCENQMTIGMIENEQDGVEQLDSEKAGLLLWALSSIFNVQNDNKL